MSNYQEKYLKYKLKYLNLLKGGYVYDVRDIVDKNGIIKKTLFDKIFYNKKKELI